MSDLQDMADHIGAIERAARVQVTADDFEGREPVDCTTCGELGTICPDCRADRYHARNRAGGPLYMQQFGRALRPRPSRLVRARRWFLGADGEAHRQVYHAWRDYPIAMRFALSVGFVLGFCWYALWSWAWT